MSKGKLIKGSPVDKAIRKMKAQRRKLGLSTKLMPDRDKKGRVVNNKGKKHPASGVPRRPRSGNNRDR